MPARHWVALSQNFTPVPFAQFSPPFQQGSLGFSARPVSAGFILEHLRETRSSVCLNAGDFICEASRFSLRFATKAQGRRGHSPMFFGPLEPTLVEGGCPRRWFEKESGFVQFAALELLESVRHVLPGDKLH